MRNRDWFRCNEKWTSPFRSSIGGWGQLLMAQSRVWLLPRGYFGHSGNHRVKVQSFFFFTEKMLGD